MDTAGEREVEYQHVGSGLGQRGGGEKAPAQVPGLSNVRAPYVKSLA